MKEGKNFPPRGSELQSPGAKTQHVTMSYPDSQFNIFTPSKLKVLALSSEAVSKTMKLAFKCTPHIFIFLKLRIYAMTLIILQTVLAPNIV